MPAFFLLLACQLVTESPPATPANDATAATTTSSSPLPTADFSPTPAPLGQGRANPLLVGSVIDMPHWEITVLEIGRGDAATEAIYAANSGNDAPYNGLEFVLLKLSMLKKTDAEERTSLTLGTTGDEQRLYYTFLQSVVPPEPRLPYEGDIEAGERVEGWRVFFAGISEQNLLLQASDGTDETGITWFLQLEPDATQEVPASLRDITPTQNGITPQQAAIFGDVVTSDDWEIQINSMVQGDDALKIVEDANSLNDPPDRGMIYVALEMTVRYIGTDDSSARTISRPSFQVYDAGNFYEYARVVNPQPKLENIRLYPGGQTSGWIVMQMPANTENPILVFTPPRDSNNRQTRYLSLKTGR